MDFSITQINSPNFIGRTKLTKSENPYYHTNTGLIVGGAEVVLATILPPLIAAKRHIANPMKYAKIGLYTLPMVAIGALSDYILNKQNQKTSDSVATLGYEQAKSFHRNLKISKKNHPYNTSMNGTGITTIALLTGFLISLIPQVHNKLPKLGKLFVDVLKETGDGEGIAILLGIPTLLCGGLIDLATNIDSKNNA